MQNIHKSYARTWIGESIELKSFVNERYVEDPLNLALPSDVDSSDRLRDKMEEYFPEGGYDFDKIQEACSVKALDCKYEDDIGYTKNFVAPDGLDLSILKTLESQKNDRDERIRDSQYALFVYNNLKNSIYPNNEPLGKVGSIFSNMSSDKIKLPEVVLTVQIFRPVSRTPKYNNTLLKVDQEFLVFGHQYLNVLRDIIVCVSDQAVPGDFSENPDKPSNISCKELYKSGFFYINGIFYNDFRDPQCKDYSKEIIEWAETTARGIGPFSAEVMEETQFIDLTIQVGYPYLYLHQANCEHLLVFSDCRMMTKDDCLNRESYPMHSRYIQKFRMYCKVCLKNNARWIVTKNVRLPETPYFFCDHCFKSFNYTKNGKKIGEFEARKYFDRASIV